MNINEKLKEYTDMCDSPHPYPTGFILVINMQNGLVLMLKMKGPNNLTLDIQPRLCADSYSVACISAPTLLIMLINKSCFDLIQLLSVKNHKCY
jgi:hypothetical protein